MIATLEIEDIVKKAVQQTLLTLGVDTTTPDGILEYQKDQHYNRQARLRSEGIATTALQWIVTMALSAGAGAIVSAIVMN